MVACETDGFEGELGADSFRSWRCVNCGEVLDQQILVNRSRLEVRRSRRRYCPQVRVSRAGR